MIKPLRLVLSGPESCGKSSIASYLQQHFEVPGVPEVAREYLANRDAYTSSDLLQIARKQRATEQAAMQRAKQTGATAIVVDTDLLTIELWWREKFGELPRELLDLLAAQQADVPRNYLLCFPDIVWQADPLREHTTDRLRLFRCQLAMLQTRCASFRVLWGQGTHRQRLASDYLQSLLR
jgi:nicotinamide riboside kinase